MEIRWCDLNRGECYISIGTYSKEDNCTDNIGQLLSKGLYTIGMEDI